MPTETPQPEKPKKPPVEQNSLPTDPTESGDPVKETK
jgi:hypothetical protein